jgi:Leucine-rich repeat (LRR) protein
VNCLQKIGQLKSLTRLYLDGNKLTSLPSQIGELYKLTRLGLSNNQLTTLPAEISNLKDLTSLDLKGNPISQSERDRIIKLMPWCNIVFE